MLEEVKELVKNKEFHTALNKLGLKVTSNEEEYEVIAEYEYAVGYANKTQKVLRLSREKALEFDKLKEEEKYEKLEYYGEVRVKEFKIEDAGELVNLYIREV